MQLNRDLLEKWINDASGNLQDVYGRYEEFCEVTGSEYSYENYCREVRKVGRGRQLDSSTGKGFEIEQKVQGNEMSLETSRKNVRIHSLKELLDFCKVNLSVWKVDKHVVNPWEVTMKLPRKVINPAVIDWVTESIQVMKGGPANAARLQEIVDRGEDLLKNVKNWTKESGHEVVTRTNWQVKAWLSKRVPDATVMPPLQNVNVSLPSAGAKGGTAPDEARSLKTALIISDAQMAYKRDLYTNKLTPYHDRLIWDTVVKVALETQPDRIILNGDMLDLPDWSDKFIRSPECYWTLQPALVELAWWIGQLRLACPSAKIDYIEGNHEERMPRSVLKYQIAAYGLRRVDNLQGHEALSIPNLLGLEKLGVEWHGGYPAGHIWLNRALRVCHSNHLNLQKAAKESRYSEIWGHIHTFGLASSTAHWHDGEETVQFWSFGTMAKTDGSVPAATDRVDWQQGFGRVHYKESGTFFHVEPIPVIGNRCMVDGLIYEGEGRDAELYADTREAGVEFFHPTGVSVA